jgi:dihydroorotase
LELYAEAFDRAGALDRLEGFASFFGADFYRLPRNREQVQLERSEWPVPGEFAFDGGHLVPLRAGDTIRWRLVD